MASSWSDIVPVISPELGVAAYKAGLPPRDKQQIETWDRLYAKHRELLDIKDDKTAYEEFNSLDTSIQEMLKSTFNANYMARPKDWTIGRIVGNVLSAANPIKIGVGALQTWSNVLSLGPAAIYSAAQGDYRPELLKVWRKDWDGKKIFDQGATTALDEAYGAGMGVLARGIASGLTPGEIIEEQGGVNPELEFALNYMYDNPEKFTEILGDYKRTQFSVGRFAAKGLLGQDVATPFQNTAKEKAFDRLSGVYDATFQIAADPLTYMTLGFGAALKGGSKLAKLYNETGGTLGTKVNAVFNHPKLGPQVKQYWNALGPLLNDLNNAKSPGEKAKIRREIAIKFPEYNNDKILNELMMFDDGVVKGVKDADTAQRFFSSYEHGNPNALINGRTDSMLYYRSQQVATANRMSIVSRTVRDALDKTFNKATDAKEVDPLVSDIASSYKLARTAEELAKLSDNNPAFKAAEDEMNGFLAKISKFGTRHPLGKPIQVSDEKILESTPTFNQLARIVHPKRIADGLTQTFIASNVGERVALIRGLMIDVLHSSGLGNHPNGVSLINEIVNEKFIGKAATRIKVADDYVPKGGSLGRIEKDNTGTYLVKDGAIQPLGYSNEIGNLDWHSISEHVSKLSLSKELKDYNNVVSNLRTVSSIVNGKFSSEITNLWSVLTLFPKLGVRGTVDELFFFVNYAPKEALHNFFSLKGLAGAKINAIATKSAKGISLTAEKGQKLPELITDAETEQIIKFALNSNPNTAAAKLEAREQLADLAITRFTGLSGKALSSDDKKHLVTFLSNNPYFIDSISSGVASHMLGVGKKVNTAIDISDSNLTLAFKELEKEFVETARFKAMPEQANIVWRQLEHFRLFFTVGSKNSFQRFGLRVEDPINYAMRNNGLKTANDLNNAVDEMVARFLDPANAQGLRNYIEADINNIRYQNMPDIAVVKDRAEMMLLQIREILHGSADFKVYNPDLVGYLNSTVKGGNFSAAVSKLDKNTFDDLTRNHIISTEGRYSPIVPKSDNVEGIIAKGEKNLFEFMDRQIMSMFRTPAFMSLFLANMQKYKTNGFYKGYLDETIAKTMALQPKTPLKQATAKATALADQYFTELAARDASDLMVKYVDNPDIRSQLAFSLRNGARFYRATEDFIRRMYRMKDVSLRAMMRMRLSALGLEASGVMHEDQQGQKYLLMPMDDAMFQIIDKPLRVLQGGKSGYSQPLFGDFTIRLSQINPSFGPDAAMPTLSGPIAGANVWLFKSILGRWGGEPGKELADVVDNALLGDIGDNITLRKAIVPASIDRVWKILAPGERDKQEVTAAHQAIAYDAAHGRGLSPNATPDEQYEYIKNIRIAAHNVVVMRNLIGLMPVPFSPTVKESKDVPNFLKDVGIASIRQEFFDIYEKILQAPNPRLDNPYEEALAIYIGKNPGKLIYTVSRAEKERAIAFNKTDEVKKWFLKNGDTIDKYGEVAFLAAPSVGDFSASAYAWFEAADMIKNKDLETYLRDVQVAQDKAKYFDVEDAARFQLQQTTNPTVRKNIKANMDLYRETLKMQNPLLKQVLESGEYGTAKEEAMLNQLNYMIADESIDMDPVTREKLRQAAEVLNTTLGKILSGGFDYDTAYKREIRDLAIRDLTALGRVDANVRQANNAIFLPILKNYSKDVRLG